MTNSVEPLTAESEQLLRAAMYHWRLCSFAFAAGECDCALPDALRAIERAAATRAGWDRKAMETALLDIQTVLGPTAPTHKGVCFGCQVEIEEALETCRVALGR